ncbi:alpha-amylase family glycosyl hydrolase [Dysgonomonas sp. ZJ279]|uniref:alpha-amylase family glycosyl hydrolase n=1 Tax=Dysgonomonas sp. ZJ279 TaxID=2709796 RepID=UPI0013EAB57E|nr:alpha-amylase family glycosyl hydrolase [Dysgonomonas sp. ZJ279]
MNTIKLFVLGLIAIFSFYSCSDDEDDNWQEIPNTEITPVSKNNNVIYEVNIRNYSAEGNFKGLEKDLPRLKELGVDILWLMPIHPVGEKNKIGTKGSPYSIKDYKAINPDYGTDTDLKSLIATAHASGIKIWFDWVANHTAWDHVWVGNHLNFYASKNGVRPYSPENWSDVIQLDYKNADMRAEMIDAMKYWVESFDIDGYRCDAATYIPLSFWHEARTEIDKVKEITWLCEGDNASYMQVFDYDYAWSFNTALNDFGKTNNISNLVSECNKLFSNNAYTNKGRMIYLTNHDLNAYDGTEFTRYGKNVLPLTVLSFTIYDMPLIYNGQEIGMDKVMGLFDVVPVVWTPANNTYNDLFKKLTQLKRTQPALEDGTNRGVLKVYPTNNEDIFVYSRKRGTNEVITMLNLTDHSIKFKFSNTTPLGTFRDYLKGGNQDFSLQTEIELPANGYSIYVK